MFLIKNIFSNGFKKRTVAGPETKKKMKWYIKNLINLPMLKVT